MPLSTTIVGRLLIWLAAISVPLQGTVVVSCDCTVTRGQCHDVERSRHCCCSTRKVRHGCCSSHHVQHHAGTPCGRGNACRCGAGCRCGRSQSPDPVAPPVENPSPVEKLVTSAPSLSWMEATPAQSSRNSLPGRGLRVDRSECAKSLCRFVPSLALDVRRPRAHI